MYWALSEAALQMNSQSHCELGIVIQHLWIRRLDVGQFSKLPNICTLRNTRLSFESSLSVLKSMLCLTH